MVHVHVLLLDTATLGHLDTPALEPVSDGLVLLATSAGGAGSAATYTSPAVRGDRHTAFLASRVDVLVQGVTNRLGVFLGQINDVVRAIEAEADGFVSLAAVQVVDED